MKTSKLFLAVVVVASALFVTFSARAEFTCGLSFPHAPSTALANFPVLVRLAEDAPTGFHYTDCQTAANLWFTDSNNVMLPFDVDTWDTTGESLVWVSVPLLSSTATITMHWDSSGAPAGQPDSTNVWSRASYVGVWHMNELVYDSVKAKHYTPDASASGWNAYKVTQSDAVPAPVTTATGVTANTTPLTGTAMNIAYGAGKDKSSFGGFAVPMAQTSSFTLGGSGFTLSAIVNAQQIANDGRGRVIAFGDGFSDMANLSVGRDTIYVMGPGGGNNYHNRDHTKGAADWVYAVGVFNSPYSKIYADGVCRSTGATDGKPSLASLTLSKGIGLGCFIDGRQTLNGYLDEARIRNAPSTADWLAAEYATVSDASYVYFAPVDDGSDVLSIGAPVASDITGTSATISGSLAKLGAGATSAEVWLVVSCGGTTNTFSLGSTNAVPATMATSLTGLAPATEYTCYFTASNNASPAVGVDSQSSTFTTVKDVSQWEPSGATFTTDGRWITARVNVTRLCAGTTTLYLMTGDSVTSQNTVSASAVISEIGTVTISGEIAEDILWYQNAYYSLMLVSDAPGSVVTNWPKASGDVFYDKNFMLEDDSTYTWVGGSSGVWTNTACWSITAAGSKAASHPAGYPVRASKAVFASADGDGPITVTLPAATGTTHSYDNPCWYVSYLDLSGMHSPLVFTSEELTKTDSYFVIGEFIATQPYNHVVFDACNVIIWQNKGLGAESADANGENFTITFKNGSSFFANYASGRRVFDATLALDRPGRKVVVADGSIVPLAYNIFGGSSSAEAPTVLEIDNATVTTTTNNQKVEPDSYNQYNGMVIRLKGADASFSAGYFLPKYANSTNVIEFVIPAGGYNAAPVQTTHNSNVFGETGAKAPMTLRVAKDSPGLASMPKAGVQLLYSKGGINAANVRFEDVKANYNGFFFKDADGNEYGDAAAIEAAGKTPDEIKEIWYRNIRGGFSVIVL